MMAGRRGRRTTALDLMSEKDWVTWIIRAAQLNGWNAWHPLPARTKDGWRTLGQGNPGAPDIWLARNGVVMGSEAKTNTGRVEPEQRYWLDKLGPHGYLWRPRDRDTVLELLQ
jgi:hypothetical protein